MMFVGGMSGSTAGGIKIMRHLMLFRIAQFKVEYLLARNGYKPFKVAGKKSHTHAIIWFYAFF